MADIFISYKSERRAAAWHLSQILELNGYTVWYDYGLLSGRGFAKRIEKEIRAAKAVIVLWCPLSRDSDWVNNEALLARRLNKYIPVWIEETELPLEFIRDDTIDLKRWNGSPRSHDLDRLWDEVGRLVGHDQAPNMKGIREFEATWRGYGALSMVDFPQTAVSLDNFNENITQEKSSIVTQKHERYDVSELYKVNIKMPYLITQGRYSDSRSREIIVTTINQIISKYKKHKFHKSIDFGGLYSNTGIELKDVVIMQVSEGVENLSPKDTLIQIGVQRPLSPTEEKAVNLHFYYAVRDIVGDKL